MNLIEIPDRSKRLEQNRERLTKVFLATVKKVEENLPAEDRRTEKQLVQEIENGMLPVIEGLLEGFDQTGFFIAYVGD